MAESTNVLSENKGGILFLTIQRESKLNALNFATLEEIKNIFDEVNDNRDIRAVIITGAGEKAFSVGGDIKDRARANAESAATTESPLVTRQTKFSTAVRTPPQAIATLNKISIALLHGYVVGTGLLMSLACDVRIAADTARLGLTEVRLGFMPASGGTQRLVRLVGIAKALEICLSGELYDAQEAYRIGLVNNVVAFDELIPAGKKMAHSFVEGAPLALRYIKEAIYKGSQLPLDQALRLESDLAGMVLNTEDAKEGPRAFVEKRAPVWKGR
jgi:enoyl-CoA hydratase